MPKRPTKTAAELVEDLRTDEGYQRKLAEQAERSAQILADVRADERSLIQGLASIGVMVGSVWDFVGSTTTPHDAVPVLLDHLNKPHIPKVREGIFRSLAYSHLRDLALRPLIALFPHLTVESDRWLAANVISTMASFREVAELPGIETYRGLFGADRRW
jgi:hypothetical protein